MRNSHYSQTAVLTFSETLTNDSYAYAYDTIEMTARTAQGMSFTPGGTPVARKLPQTNRGVTQLRFWHNLLLYQVRRLEEILQ